MQFMALHCLFFCTSREHHAGTELRFINDGVNYLESVMKPDISSDFLKFIGTFGHYAIQSGNNTTTIATRAGFFYFFASEVK